MGHLSNRGYPKELLRVEIQRASDIPREDSFQLQKQKKMERTPLVITYHPALHCRMNNHRADIIYKRIEDKPVATHFNTQGHSVEDLAVMVIERLWKDDPVLRKIRENKWIRTLDTPHPRGMNLRTTPSDYQLTHSDYQL